MKKTLLTLALALSSVPGHAGTSIKLGANIVDFSDVTSNVNVDHASEKGKWQQVYDLEHIYQSGTNRPKNELYALAKVNLALNDKTYLVNVIKYEYDQYQLEQHNFVGATGIGYKLYRSDTLKISNELTGGAMYTDAGTRPVVRNSLWVRYNSGKYSFVNKLLVEQTNHLYVRNQTELGYKLDKNLSVGLRHVYSSSYDRTTNVSLINLGINF